MASIAKRSDGRWRARYRDAAGVEHSRHFTRKVEAQHWLDTVTTALTSGMYTDPRRSRITVSDWAARWLATKVDLKATTRRGYDGILRVHILTRWGAVKLADITHEQIARWIAELRGRGLSASTVGRSTACSRWCLHWRCVTGASRAIRQTVCRSLVPRQGSEYSSRTISSMRWLMQRGANGS
jgi:hypothetical protein